MNAGTRLAEKAKPEKYKALCTQRGPTFAPVIFTTGGGMREQLQRQLWHPWTLEASGGGGPRNEHRPVGLQEEEADLCEAPSQDK